jgi:Uncharacterized protein conserved in bacteria (DUF2188)
VAKKGRSVHVVPSPTTPGKFVNKLEGGTRAISRPTTQAKSIEKAIPVAKQNRSEIVIHGRDGRVRSSDSYGVPAPASGKKH